VKISNFGKILGHLITWIKSGVNCGVKSGVKNSINSGVIFLSSDPLSTESTT